MFRGGGARLSPLGSSATLWPVVPAQDDTVDVDRGAVEGMRIGRGNRSTWETTCHPVSLCPSLIPHDLTWAQTRAAAVGSRRLAA
jgi:hypothetical protein